MKWKVVGSSPATDHLLCESGGWLSSAGIFQEQLLHVSRQPINNQNTVETGIKTRT